MAKTISDRFERARRLSSHLWPNAIATQYRDFVGAHDLPLQWKHRRRSPQCEACKPSIAPSNGAVNAHRVCGGLVPAHLERREADRCGIARGERGSPTKVTVYCCAILREIKGVLIGGWLVGCDVCGSGEDDDVAAATVALEVERNMWVAGDIAQPGGSGKTVDQEAG